MRGRVRAILVGAAAVGLLAVGAGPAAAAPAAASGWPCGYFEDGSSAWYNHCTSDGSAVEIHIDYVAAPDKTGCMGGGVTRLGFAYQIRNAWYTGKLC